MKRLNDQKIEEIILLYNSGVPPKEIGEKFGIMNNSVTRILRKKGIDRNQAADCIREDAEKVKYIIKQYTDGVSSEIIAKELGINGSTVCRILKKNNIIIRPSIENKRKYALDKT
jgi:DNA invertase Pin-like site-specific DNA recombinase